MPLPFSHRLIVDQKAWRFSSTDTGRAQSSTALRNIVSESDLRAGVDRLAAYVKKLPKETIVEPLKKAGKVRG